MKASRVSLFFGSTLLALAALGSARLPGGAPQLAALRRANCSVPVVRRPSGLPAPVTRYFSVLFGPTYLDYLMPQLEPAVVTGRRRTAAAGRLSRRRQRIQAYYDTSARFRRAMDVAWLGLPVAQGVDASFRPQGRSSREGAC